MPPRPAHKRSAASNGEGPSQRNAKKTRFVEPEDDPANFAEEVDSQLENPSAHRKGRVKTEGYDSDSTDDGEGVVLSRRTGGGVGDDEDDDMFNMEEKEDKKDEDESEDAYVPLLSHHLTLSSPHFFLPNSLFVSPAPLILNNDIDRL